MSWAEADFGSVSRPGNYVTTHFRSGARRGTAPETSRAECFPPKTNIRCKRLQTRYKQAYKLKDDAMKLSSYIHGICLKLSLLLAAGSLLPGCDSLIYDGRATVR